MTRLSSVVTTSMLPLILPSDKVIVSKKKAIRTDDIVVFETRDDLIAHRVVYIKNKELFITKGDNNEKDDGYIKSSNVLGKIESINRSGEILKLDKLYLMQSVAYLKEVGAIVRKLHKELIAYVVLKGFPVHYYVEGDIPRRLLIDLDLLVSVKNFKIVERIILSCGFLKMEEGTHEANQVTYYKECLPYPVQIDLHKQAAIGFTRTPTLNKFFYNVSGFDNMLLRHTRLLRVGGASFKILDNEYLLVYLLIHFFHHNLKGSFRMELIKSLCQKSVDVTKALSIIEKFNLKGFVYPSISVILKFYKSQTLFDLQKTINVPIDLSIVTFFVVRFGWPFRDGNKSVNRIIRFIYMYIFSTKSLIKKIMLLFSYRFMKEVFRSGVFFLRS